MEARGRERAGSGGAGRVPTTDGMLRVCSEARLRADGVATVRAGSGRVAVFADARGIYAVDNRCPHMGFPLDRGTVRDGILTCHWHQARFDLESGCTFDLFADDVPRHAVVVRDGDVFVSPSPSARRDAAYHRKRLRTAVELDVPLVQAKSLLGLLDLDADLAALVRETVLFAARNLATFGEGLVRLTCVANLYPSLDRDTAYHALLYAIRRIAREVAGSVPRRAREPLDSGAHDTATLARWMKQWVRTRHRDASERTLLTALRCTSPQEVATLVAGAASERMYANTGHVLDAANKALELSDHLGAGTSAELLPLLMIPLTQSRGEEESTDWHHPIEIVEPLRAIEARLGDTLAAGRDAPGGGLDGDALVATLSGDDPIAILDALERALAEGAEPEEVARHVAWAASLRLARFATSNEVTDWLAPQHALNFANAAHQLVVRAGTDGAPGPDVVRSVFHAAIAVYTDRYLNVPPARPPTDRALDALPREPDAIRDALLGLLDQRSEIDAAAALVARWVRLGHPTAPLVDTLVFAAVREDIDFHCLQVLDASARQCAAWTRAERPDAVESVLVGAVRSLAAHCPTRRAGQQTATIAMRLHRGDAVFE